MGERSRRPEIADAQRLLDRERATHDLLVDRFDASVGEGAVGQLEDSCEDRSLSVRRVDRTTGLLLDLAHLDNDLGPLVEELYERTVERIDPGAKWREFIVRRVVAHRRMIEGLWRAAQREAVRFRG